MSKLSLAALVGVAGLTASLAAAGADTSLTLGGRLQADAALYNDDVTPLGSGTEFRRLRLFAQGTLDEHWGYKLQFDFAGGDAAIKDAFLRYTGWDKAVVTVGNFKVPFALEDLTSSKYSTFMERGLPVGFTSSRRMGAGLNASVGHSTFAGMIYGDEASSNGADEGTGFGARATTAPKVGRGFLHLGAALLYEEPTLTDAGVDSVRFRERPESHVTSSRMINTGSIADVSHVAKTGLEAAWTAGPWSVQGEFMNASVETVAADYDFNGWYLFGSWFPGGQTRAYSGGVFQRVDAIKAWELALRFSSLDLNDGAVRGGKQDDITLGVNYYVSPYLRFMLNYVKADVTGGINGNEDPSVLQFRVAMDFKK